MIHCIDQEEAVKYGVNAAFILHHLKYWIRKNIANEKHFIDGEYWTYNSVKAFHKLMPFISEKQIRSAIGKLENDGIIGVSEYNKTAYDRTKWYSIRDKSILQKVQMDEPKRANGLIPEGEPIPVSNTDSKQDITSKIPFSAFWELVPKKTDKKKAEIAWNRLTIKKQTKAIADIAVRYSSTDKQFIPNPTTYIHGERWEDDPPANDKKPAVDYGFSRKAI